MPEDTVNKLKQSALKAGEDLTKADKVVGVVTRNFAGDLGKGKGWSDALHSLIRYHLLAVEDDSKTIDKGAFRNAVAGAVREWPDLQGREDLQQKFMEQYDDLIEFWQK